MSPFSCGVQCISPLPVAQRVGLFQSSGGCSALDREQFFQKRSLLQLGRGGGVSGNAEESQPQQPAFPAGVGMGVWSALSRVAAPSGGLLLAYIHFSCSESDDL